MNLNNATSATAISQFFDAPQAITISAIGFYAWKSDTTGGISLNATVEVYAAAPDSTPTGTPLATTTVAVDTVFSPGTLAVLRKQATFTTPVTVTNSYVIVISNPSPNPMSMVFNSWTAGDGDQGWLASAQIGASWLRAYNLNIGGALFDADGLIEPHTTYDLSANFVVDPCIQAGALTSFTNGSSPIVNHRMYNVAAFQSVTDLSYSWDYGDGSPLDNTLNGANNYATPGAYTVTLTDTIYGWTTNCADDTMASITVLDAVVADYTSSAAGLTATFTNTSTAGPGASYLWDFGDGGSDASVDPSHTYSAGGSYVVTLVVTDSCGTNTFVDTVSTTVGINELSLVDLSVYPNPSQGVFAVSASVDMESAYITDLSGKLIYTGDLKGNKATIDVSPFANGTYFLSIQFANEMIQTVRLEVVK